RCSTQGDVSHCGEEPSRQLCLDRPRDGAGLRPFRGTVVDGRSGVADRDHGSALTFVGLLKEYRLAAAGRLGFRILSSPPRLDDAILSRFKGAASSNLADAMGRFNYMD